MDDVLVNKAAVIERCIKRVLEEYRGHESELETNFTRQDSIVLNLQRACEAAIDLGMRIVRLKQLGVPQSSRDIFVLLEEAHIIDGSLSKSLQGMVGFRNIAIHDYRKMSLEIVRHIVDERLADLAALGEIALKLA